MVIPILGVGVGIAAGLLTMIGVAESKVSAILGILTIQFVAVMFILSLALTNSVLTGEGIIFSILKVCLDFWNNPLKDFVGNAVVFGMSLASVSHLLMNILRAWILTTPLTIILSIRSLINS